MLGDVSYDGCFRKSSSKYVTFCGGLITTRPVNIANKVY